MARRQRWNDRTLGMDRPIDRRDFLNGVAVAIGAIGAPGFSLAADPAAPWPQDQPGYYPPALNGLRGSHPGSFETAHALRDGDFWSAPRRCTTPASTTTWWWSAAASAGSRRRTSTAPPGRTRRS